MLAPRKEDRRPLTAEQMRARLLELDEALVRTRDEIMKDVTTPG